MRGCARFHSDVSALIIFVGIGDGASDGRTRALLDGLRT
jgi:hypothetical protein